MVRMNRVTIAGNLTRDPVLRKTSSGVSCADLGLAVSDGYTGKNGKSTESTCFVDVVTWEKSAEACGEYLQKGAPVLVEGKLQFEQWTGKDGAKHSKLRVRADRVHFLGSPGKGAARGDRPPDDEH